MSWFASVVARAFRRQASAYSIVLLLPLGAINFCPDSVDAPPPTIATTKPIDPGESSVTVPVLIPLEAVRSWANQQLPNGDHVDPYNLSLNGGADHCGEGVSIGYDVARSPIEMSAHGSAITTTLPINYSVRGRARVKGPLGICLPGLVGGQCGADEPRRTASVAFTTALALEPTWHVTSHTNAAPAVAGTRCQVTFLNFDVTDRILDAFNHAFAIGAGQLDAHIAAALDLHPPIERLWVALSQPIAIAPNTWLNVNPQQAGIGQFAFDDKQLSSGIMLRARPSIVYGAKPTTTATPLPDASAVPAGNAFSLTVPIDATYEAVDAQIASAFKLHDGGIRYPASGEYYVIPTNVAVYGYGSQAVARIRFSGSAKGTIYLAGTPVFDAGRSILSFPDLDYTLETKNLLAKLVNWQEQERFRTDLRNRLKLDLSQQVARARAMAQQSLNRTVGPVTLHGTVDAMRLLGVYAFPDSGTFRAIAAMNGSLSASVDGVIQ